MTYVVGERRDAKRFLFVKLDGAWQIDRVLQMHQLAEAHPYETPTSEHWARNELAWVVARELEQRLNAAHPGMESPTEECCFTQPRCVDYSA